MFDWDPEAVTNSAGNERLEKARKTADRVRVFHCTPVKNCNM